MCLPQAGSKTSIGKKPNYSKSVLLVAIGSLFL